MSSIIRFFRSRFHHDHEEEGIDQYSLFDMGNRGGFPSDVVAFEYRDGLIVVGTARGDVTFYGYHGASWTVNLNDSQKVSIQKIVFVSSNTVFVLCKGPVLIPVQINDGTITIGQKVDLPENAQFRWHLTHVQPGALLFYMNGNVYRVKQDIMQAENLIDNGSISLWSDSDLISMTSLPEKPNLIILIGEQVGLYNEKQFLRNLVVKSEEDEKIEKFFWSAKSHAYGISCNNKYTKWKIKADKDLQVTFQEVNLQNSNQFGPYPCHQIRHFSVCPNVSKPDCDFLIYQGGKSSGKHDDRDLISVSYGDTLEKFELPADVVGIAAVSGAYDGNKHGVVLICTKCEIIGLNLEKEKDTFRMLQPRHFLSINNSTPTCHSKTIEISENVWSRLEITSKQFWESSNMSVREWPLFSQKKSVTEANPHRTGYRQIYLTGHSNGNICLWSSGGVGMSLLLIIRTSIEFELVNYENEDDNFNKSRENLGKPVQKIGLYDPFDDDDEMCLNRVHLDPKSGIVIAANRGGFILMYELHESNDFFLPWQPIVVSCNGNNKEDRKPLRPRRSEIVYSAGYQLRRKNETASPLVFLIAAGHQISDISYLHKYNCLVVGTNLGILMLDVKHGYLVHSNSFNGTQLNGTLAESNQLKRFKSLKKSLRRTFRRKKKIPLAEINDEPALRTQTSTVDREIEETTYVEREICAREELTNVSLEKSPSSVICLKLMRFPIVDDKNVDDVVAIGLHDGHVYFYTINEHDVGLRMTFKVEQVRKLVIPNKQPILNIDITNEDGYCSTSTKLIIITEEQIRIYNCQPMTKRDSYKITALEGLKIQNGVVARISNKKNSNSFESFVVILTNNGMLRVHSVQNPSHFDERKFIDAEDVVALNSNSLCRDGEVGYLIKSSELQRSTLNSNSRGWQTSKK